MRKFRSDYLVEVGGSRGVDWLTILGTAILPIESAETVEWELTQAAARTLSTRRKHRFYRLKLDELTDLELRRVVTFLARKFNLTEEAVLLDIPVYGVPILAYGCSAPFLNPHRGAATHEPSQ